jgi:hypothetical protein
MQRFTPGGAFVSKWSTGRQPYGIDLDRTGNVYVAHQERIDGVRVFTPNGRLLTKWIPDAVNPIDVAVDSAGSVYVLDSFPDTVEKYRRVAVAKIISGPRDRVSSRRARFVFRSDEPGPSARCKLDGRKWKPCSSPIRYRGLKPGRHVFRVRATLGGERGPVARRAWRVLR